MIRKIIFPVLLMSVCLGCKKKDNPILPPVPPPVDTTSTTGKPNNQHVSVFTQHNDNSRAGFNSHETSLTTANVNSKQFGRLFTLTVDDQVYAQQLVYAGLKIGGNAHNVVFIATVNNTVYAFDGDNGHLYWKNNFTIAGMSPPNSSQMASVWCTPYSDITSNIGIIGTPVIDSASKTIYFVARSTNGTDFFQYLHAVNLSTGAEQGGSPVKIAAHVPGTGDGNVGGVVNFDPRRNNQRQALTLVNGTVYISFSSHCDWNPYHGWILGYSASTLKQQTVYNVTPDGEEGGLWESGMGIAADAEGNLYVVSGNGTVGKPVAYSGGDNGTAESTSSTDPTDLSERGESALKLTPSGSTLTVSSYFTPTNYLDLNVNDLDYGVMGTLLIPNTRYYLTGSKDGNVYLVDKDNMGGYSPSSNQVLQTVPLNVSLHCQPAYYKGGGKEFVYIWSENDQLRALPFSSSSASFGSQLVSSLPGPVGPIGANLSVSSNGSVDGTGILWAAYGTSGDAGGSVGPGILRAFDAKDITKELWNSRQTGGDSFGNFAKFCSPTVVNGHVYMGTFSNKILVYGLK